MRHAWAKDTAYIKANYMTMTSKEMAIVLGCTPGAMSTQLSKMQLSRREQTKANGDGQPTPPRTRDLLHTNYVQPTSFMDCPRDGGLDYKNLPSVHGPEAVYQHTRGHA